jgi:hypothetical protein
MILFLKLVKADTSMGEANYWLSFPRSLGGIARKLSTTKRTSIHLIRENK